MKMAMKAAVENELIVKSPCLAKAPPAASADMRFLTVDQLDHLAAQFEPSLRPLIYVLGYGGLRWGEAAGLRRKHVDTIRRTIRVEEQLNDLNGQLTPGVPVKSRAGVRTVAIPVFLAEMLDAHFLNLEQRRHDAGLPPLGPDDFVFLGKTGKLLRRSAFRSNYWIPATAAAGFKGLRVHDLRHTAVALAINLSNAHPKAVQVRMGHSSIQVTYDRYGHLFPQMDDDIAAAMDAAFRAERKPRTGVARIVPIATVEEPNATQIGHA
jgi:integrase